MISKEEILSFVKQNGPTMISDIVSKYNSDSFIIGAMLSELKNKGELKTSHLKIGSSPLYYVEKDRKKLENYIEELHKKEKAAYELIKEKKVVREKELDPAIRVAMKNIKDFAKELDVKLNDKKITFYKRYDIDSQTAKKLISQNLSSEIKKFRDKNKEKQKPKETQKETKQKQEKPNETKEKPKETKEPKQKSKEQKEEKEEKEPKQTKIKESSDVSEILDKVNKEELLEDVIKYVFSKSEIIKTISLKKPIRGILKFDSEFGKIKYFFVIADRKKATKSTLYESILLASKENLPCMIIANESANTIDKELKDKNINNVKIIDNDTI